MTTMGIAGLVVALLAVTADAEVIRIVPGKDPTQVEVTVALAGDLLKKVPAGTIEQEQGERWLRLCRVEEGIEGPAIFGKYQRQGNELRFTPRYGLAYEGRYRAILSTSPDNKQTLDYKVPARIPTQPAVVEKIYPTAEELPANLLKFYVHFSKPMREGKEIFERMHILDSNDKPIEDPWRRVELWTADARRLSLSIHPGRIKQGVNLREDFGPVLEPNRKYTLVIDADMQDAEGQPLGQRFTKSFTTVAEDRQRPIPREWNVAPPPAGARDPLVVRFPEPLDRYLLVRYLKVWDADGRRIEGQIEVGAGERSWSFAPAAAWQSARHTITVEEELEDLAGNTPLRLFDTDLTLPAPAPANLTVPFVPRTIPLGTP